MPGRAPARCGLRRARCVALLVVALMGASAPVASASWSRPTRLSGPWSLDVLPAQIRFSSAGAAAIGYGIEDPANPAASSALLTTETAKGQISKPRRIPGAQQILDLAFQGSTLELLTGTSAAGFACCSSAQTVRMPPSGSPSRPRALVSGLTGSALGRLLALQGGGLLATVATQRGVWAAQAQKGDRFGQTRRLTGAGGQPQTLAATSLAKGHTAIAWTASSGVPGGPGPRSISVAEGTSSRAPGAATAVTVPPGHQIDELQMTSAGTIPTVAWIESWLDRGAYHSQPIAEDLSRRGRPHPFPVGSQLASRLTLAGDGAGDQVLAWAQCSAAGDCTVKAATRRAGGRFSAATSLGSIDASQAPAVTVAPGGEAFVGWSDSRGVELAGHGAKATRFGAPEVIGTTTPTADLTLAAGSSGQVITVWSQAVQSPTLMAATYRPR